MFIVKKSGEGIVHLFNRTCKKINKLQIPAMAHMDYRNLSQIRPL